MFFQSSGASPPTPHNLYFQTFMDWTVTGQLWTCLCVCMPERQSICSNVKLSLFHSAPLTSLSSLPAEPITVLRESKCSYREESAWFTTEIRQQTLLSFSLCTSNTQKHTVRKQSTKNAVTGLHVVSSCFKSFVIELVIVCIISWLMKLVAQLHKNL